MEESYKSYSDYVLKTCRYVCMNKSLMCTLICFILYKANIVLLGGSKVGEA